MFQSLISVHLWFDIFFDNFLDRNDFFYNFFNMNWLFNVDRFDFDLIFSLFLVSGLYF